MKFYSPFFQGGSSPTPIDTVYTKPTSTGTTVPCPSGSGCVGSSGTKTPIQNLIDQMDWLDVIIIIGIVAFIMLIGFAAGRVR